MRFYIVVLLICAISNSGIYSEVTVTEIFNVKHILLQGAGIISNNMIFVILDRIIKWFRYSIVFDRGQVFFVQRSLG